MIRFGSPEELGYEEDFPIVTLKIAPKSEKFADKLTHRDFLGALMSLGIEREVLGDIVIRDNVGYLFAKEDIAEYIKDSLTEIKHTAVRINTADSLPEGELYRIAVLPAYRGAGLGRLLLAEFLAALADRGADECYLEVRAENTVAQALYASCGFLQVGRRKNYYKDPRDDALVLKRGS